MKSLEEKLEDLFINKLPPLPENIKEKAVQFFPWVMIVLGVFGFVLWLSSLHFLFGIAGPFSCTFGIFSAIYFIASPIVQAMAVYGGYIMLSRQLKGWNISLYAILIGLIINIFCLSILGILLDLVFAYILFQIKRYFADAIV